MPATNPQHPTDRRPLAFGLGATEVLFLIGLVLLAAGLGLLFGPPMASAVCGGLLVLSAWWNDIDAKR